MQTALFVMPLKPGKKQAYFDFVTTCMEQHYDEYKDMLERYDLNIVKVWAHTIDGKDYAMFVHEMGDAAQERLAQWPGEHPFDRWFNEQLRDCYTFDGLENAPEQPLFIGEIK